MTIIAVDNRTLQERIDDDVKELQRRKQQEIDNDTFDDSMRRMSQSSSESALSFMPIFF